ncbi:MAG: aminopeptidase P family protein [Deltaproteobacteria bacterium]|nr:aminopeptidase P family protein [Deltaproteobacteria bacterium]MBW2677059.1 aminopeptidase P family protein [Deltaproteobacteria bacterium]
MTTFSIPSDEIQQRLLNLQKRLRSNNLDGALIIQRVDLMYFAGTAQNGCMYVPAHGIPLLFIKRSHARAQKESPLKTVLRVHSIKAVPALIRDISGHLPAKLGLELDVMPVNQFKFIGSLFPGCSLADISPSILEIRMIKSDWDIARMEHTADMSAATFTYIREVLKEGYTEMEFAGMFETFARRIGHGGKIRIRDYQTEGYPWHVLSGKSGSQPGVLDSPASGQGTSLAFPCGAGNKQLRAGEPIMVDFAAVRNGFHMDETRMFAIDAMPKKAMQACEDAIKIHDFILEKAEPGISSGELFQLARDRAGVLGCADSFLGPHGSKVRFIGHGIGHELIEPPIIARGKKDVLMPGMTIALEPKLVVKNEFTAGIESVFAVTATGSRLISRVPVEVFIC